MQLQKFLLLYVRYLLLIKIDNGLNRIETPRDFAFCLPRILKQNVLFIVKDASKDDGFRDNPLIPSDPSLFFYAGAPLNSEEEYPLGILCVLDKEPNDLDENQKESLKLVSKRVTYLIELRKKNQKLMKAYEQFLRLHKQLSEFAYRLSHDIKTSIRGIKYLSESIQENDAEHVYKMELMYFIYSLLGVLSCIQ